MARRRRDKGEEKRLVRSRIQRLLHLAHTEALGPDKDLADRYAVLARRLGMRYKTPLDASQKMQICRGCGAYRGTSQTGRVRIHRNHVSTTCLACGRIDRRPLGPRPEPTNPRRRGRTTQ